MMEIDEPSPQGSEMNDGSHQMAPATSYTSTTTRVEASAGAILYEPPRDVVQWLNDSPDKTTDEKTIEAESDMSEVIPSEITTLAARAYQREMFEKSMQSNVIVAMDTGTGKTQVAILRIIAELERCDPEKVIWFLAPKVALCDQQYQALRLQMPAVPIRLLTGSESVDTWKPHIWAAILSQARVVVSTPQVLQDALCHSYITIGRLALLVIDEAHNTVGNSSISKIMRDFYHPKAKTDADVPAVLGLTATPSMRSSEVQMDDLETILNACCVTPTKHRAELLHHVFRPQLSHVPYPDLWAQVQKATLLDKVRHVFNGLDSMENPQVIEVMGKLKDPRLKIYHEREMRKLERAILHGDTWAQSQLKSLYIRGEKVMLELGPWAADRYIYHAINDFLTEFDRADDFFDAQYVEAKKQYVAEALRTETWNHPPDTPAKHVDFSDKVKLLIEQLLHAGEAPVGLIFAQERATVMMLRQLLETQPEVCAKYRIGTMIGSSTSVGKSSDLFDFKQKHDLKALRNFASNKTNLLIATNVLEEGIDIRTCNLVISFNELGTATSFVQRRGRARMQESKFILFHEDCQEAHKDWEASEARIKKVCEDEVRQREKLTRLETSDVSSIGEYYEVCSTGARIDMEGSKSHLEHFCRHLVRGYASRPEYLVHNYPDESVTAEVILPSCLPRDVRRVKGSKAWLSEKNATKDAALQAYKILHVAGLVNDQLLPISAERAGRHVETREPVVGVDGPLQAWARVAREWASSTDCWRYPLSFISRAGEVLGVYDVYLPVKVANPAPFIAHGAAQEQWKLQFDVAERLDAAQVPQIIDHTSTLLALHFQHRFAIHADRSHVVRVHARGTNIQMSQIGARPFCLDDEAATSGRYLIRNSDSFPFQYLGYLPEMPEPELVADELRGLEDSPTDVPHLHLKKWTKRSDFLHPLAEGSTLAAPSALPYKTVLPITEAHVDDIPIHHARFGMLIPSIIHELEVMLVAQELRDTLLPNVEVMDMALVREAISSGAAHEPVQYERLEFFGDSMLKFCASVQISADNLNWPEGFLTFGKDKLVANSRLSRAAQETGLARFILTKPFTGHKWRPLYLVDALQTSAQETHGRFLSTKVLADVVEALIGAAFVSGGLTNTLQCIGSFIGDCAWRELEVNRATLLSAVAPDEKVASIVAPVQSLIGYEFKRKSLLFEALTHSSFVGDTELRSLERLEFLGDAILDYIIVQRLFNHTPPLTHGQMHMAKTAMVNGDFLAWLALDTQQISFEGNVDKDGNFIETPVEKALWMFMRHTSASIGTDQRVTAKRYEDMRDAIRDAVATASHYPWALLAQLQAKKFFSDIIEALLGAVWLDSGDFGKCEQMLEHLGVLPYLSRILNEGVHVQHPKEELSRIGSTEKVTYRVGVKKDKVGGNEYVCRICLDEEVLVEVDGGVNREEVQTKAATKALEILKAERGGVLTKRAMMEDNFTDVEVATALSEFSDEGV